MKPLGWSTKSKNSIKYNKNKYESIIVFLQTTDNCSTTEAKFAYLTA